MSPGRIVIGSELKADLVLTPDVCVIGSGPGGAMAASRLAKAGASVVVLEEGGYHTKDDFDMQEATAFPRLYQERGNRASADLSISVLQGRAVGGGTVINWTTSYRTPAHVVDWWREKEGAAVSNAELKPHFDEVEQRLGIQKVDLEDANPNNRMLYDGCKKLGWDVDTTSRNVRGCLRSGYCGMGCPVDAKQSAALTYLPDAIASGATVHADCRVDTLEWSGRRIVAARASVMDRATHAPNGRTVRVSAKLFVLSGGALNSPALLLRSGLVQGPVGKKTWLHPVVACAAIYKDRIEGFYGAPQSVASHHFARRTEGAGFFLEAAPVHPMLSGIAMPGFGAALRANMQLLPHVATSVALVIDGFAPGEEGGTVTLKPSGGPKLDYPLTAVHAEAFRASLKALVRIHFAAGASQVQTFQTRPLTFSAPSDEALRAIDDETHFGPNRLGVFTAHQMGGCRMGSDPARSVVDPHLRHHALDNLFVLDGSVFPTSLGVNPMESIYGLSSWGATHAIEALKHA